MSYVCAWARGFSFRYCSFVWCISYATSPIPNRSKQTNITIFVRSVLGHYFGLGLFGVTWVSNALTDSAHYYGCIMHLGVQCADRRGVSTLTTSSAERVQSIQSGFKGKVK